MKHPEHEIQSAIVLYLKSIKVLFTSSVAGHITPNRFQKMRMARAGYIAGTPDLFIFAARKGYHGMALEVKAGRYPTDEQKQWQSALIAAGWYAVIMPATLKTPMESVQWARNTIEAYLDRAPYEQEK